MVTGRGSIKFEGFALALLGFFLSRLAVAESMRVADPLPFVFSELPPLLFSLGLALTGVVLAVGPASRPYVRTVTGWALLGTTVMIAAISLTVLGVALRGESVIDMIVSNMLVANVVLAGAIGGAIIGDRSAKNRRYRAEIYRQVDRARFMNRLLRHEVLNAAHVIQGYAELLSETDPSRASSVIRDAAGRIDETIGEVGELADDRMGEFTAIDLVAIVEKEAERFDDAVVVELPETGHVLADHRLRWVVAELVENAIHHGSDSSGNDRSHVGVTVDVDPGIVSLRVEDDGPGLPAVDSRLLEAGEFPDYDHPASGFGLQTVRLLVDAYGGDVTVEDGDGTAITIRFPRVNPAGVPLSGVRARSDEVLVAGGAAVVAGVAMGVYLQASTGLLPVIGSLYGIDSEIVGWITHLFHSVVFGVLFAAAVSRPHLARYDGYAARSVLGIGWGVILWLVAAGVVMPVWLHVVGVEALLPNLTRPGLVAHILWGGILGFGYAAGTAATGAREPMRAVAAFRPWRADG